jgi:hypothetical protein
MRAEPGSSMPTIIIFLKSEPCLLWIFYIAGAIIAKILSKNHIYTKTCIEKDSFKLYNNTSNIPFSTVTDREKARK